MRRISMAVIAALILGLLAPAHSQTPKSKKQKAEKQKAEPQAEAATNKRTVLVKELPTSVEGVSLKDGQVRLKSGYKFVKESNSTVSVARINGTGIGGTWKCECSNTGSCGASISPITGLDCLTESCTGSCTLKVTVGNRATAILMSKSQNVIRQK